MEESKGAASDVIEGWSSMVVEQVVWAVNGWPAWVVLTCVGARTLSKCGLEVGRSCVGEEVVGEDVEDVD